MDTIKHKNVSKYSHLSDEERKEVYKKLSHDWYQNRSPEEKKKLSQRSFALKHGKCDVCGTDREYANLPQHKQSQTHKRNLEKRNKSV